MIYTVTLNPAVDYLVRAARTDDDALSRTSHESLRVGGKGINVSRILARLGVPSVAWGFVAGFTGDFVESALSEEGIAHAFDRLSDGMTRINVKLLGDREINARGPLVGATDTARLLRRADTLTADDCLLLCGSLANGVTPPFYAALAHTACAHGATVVADAAGEALLGVLPYRPLLVKPNLHELQLTVGGIFASDAEVAAAARALQARGAQYVLASRGKDGAVLAVPDGRCFAAAAPQGEALCAVGAGDAMLASALAALTAGAPPEEVLRRGIAAGSATAFAGEPANPQQIEDLLAHVGAVHQIA